MIKHQFENLEYWSFETFREHCLNGILTRKGGVSPAPWNSLNFGGNLGDPRENIIENRRRVFNAIGRPVESIFDSWQVHGTHVLIADMPRKLDEQHQKGDIVATDRPEITLFMRFADCTPIFLCDPVRRAVSIIHAGWKGTLARAAKAAVEGMAAAFGSAPKNLLAGIGPSIGPDHYRVGDEVVEIARENFGTDTQVFITGTAGQYSLNLWDANEFILREAGVESIERSDVCTACDPERWYSHRGESGKTGRFGAFLALR